MRLHVLGVGGEGAWFDLDAVLDDAGDRVTYFGRIGGISSAGFEDDEPEVSERVVGPFTWSEVLEAELRRNRWMELYPTFIHPLVAHLVQAELPLASPRGRARWEEELEKTFAALTETAPA